MKTRITYAHADEAWKGYKSLILSLIDQHPIQSVCDVGGGANPLLHPKRIAKLGLDYTLLDIAQSELDKAPDSYHKRCADIASKAFVADGRFDLVFSKMLAEHIPDPLTFHRNLFDVLNPGGRSIHFFPTLYAWPFIANRLFPERIAAGLLRIFSPRDEHQHAKFPAFYRWCTGPTDKQLERFESVGFEVSAFHAYFGHGYYKRIPLARSLEAWRTRRFLKKPNPRWTTFACVVLQKPELSA